MPQSHIQGLPWRETERSEVKLSRSSIGRLVSRLLWRWSSVVPAGKLVGNMEEVRDLLLQFTWLPRQEQWWGHADDLWPPNTRSRHRSRSLFITGVKGRGLRSVALCVVIGSIWRRGNQAATALYIFWRLKYLFLVYSVKVQEHLHYRDYSHIYCLALLDFIINLRSKKGIIQLLLERICKLNLT